MGKATSRHLFRCGGLPEERTAQYSVHLNGQLRFTDAQIQKLVPPYTA